MRLELPVPDEILVALKEDESDFKKRAMVYILGKLYESGKVSGGLGAKGCSKNNLSLLLVFFPMLCVDGSPT